MALLALDGVTKRYAHGAAPVDALRDVTFALERGERVALAGPSGSGKSTLLHLAGLVDKPTGGEVRFDGAPTSAMPEPRRAELRLRRIGLVFQHFYLHPTLTAEDNVALPAVEAGRPLPEGRGRARALLDGVGLAARADHRPGELSGGEQQRVAIARALVNAPELVLADEPTGELDAASAERVADVLDALWQERRFALVVATHDEALARRAERVVRLRDGQLVA